MAKSIAAVGMRGEVPDPPSERGDILFGVAPEFWRDPLQALIGQWRRHGDVVRMRMGGSFYSYLLAHPDHVKYVLQDNNPRFGRHPHGSGALKPTIGEGLLTSEGSFWLRQRRLMQPAFHRQRLTRFGHVMTTEAEAIIDGWRAKAARREAVDVASEMMHLTLRIVARVMFSADVSLAELDQVERAVGISLRYSIKLSQSYLTLPLWLPFPLHRRFRGARADLDRIVYRMIDEHRQASTTSDDLLSMLLSARDADTGETMTDRQVRDEVMTIFLAGHETTAVALTWTFYLLSQHPEVARRLQEELVSVLAGRVPTVADLPLLPYTRAVVDETMRLYPPAWIVTRMPLADEVIGGYRVARGANVFMSPYITHRHPDFWNEPERFDPERFLGEGPERHRYAYFPFGGGPHLCIGNNFALLEAQLVLATIAQRFQLALVPGHPVAMEPLVTLRARYGMRMLPSEN